MRWPAVLALLLAGAAAAEERRSGTVMMRPELQAMQADDSANPAMLWVLGGAELWGKAEGAAGKSCADCHGSAETSMRGVAVRYPALDEATGTPVDLAGRIGLCRTRHQQAPPLALESEPLLGLEAYVALQSRGLPITPPEDTRLAEPTARGQALFRLRQGQLDLSCAQCHDERAGGRLGSALIPEGHPTAYPIFRLEWQQVGSLQRRLRNCLTGVRAQTPAPGAVELIEIELYLKTRAAGMTFEGPGVRP